MFPAGVEHSVSASERPTTPRLSPRSHSITVHTHDNIKTTLMYAALLVMPLSFV